MAVLLIAEVNGGALNVDATAKALSAMSSLGDVTILSASAGCEGAAAEAAKLAGVSKVLCCSDEAYGHDLAEPVADLVVSLAGDYTHIAGPVDGGLQEHPAARCGPFGCDGDLRSHRRRGCGHL